MREQDGQKMIWSGDLAACQSEGVMETPHAEQVLSSTMVTAIFFFFFLISS